jgi:hypothetical protein
VITVIDHRFVVSFFFNSYIAGHAREKSDTFRFLFSASGEYMLYTSFTVLAFVLRESFGAYRIGDFSVCNGRDSIYSEFILLHCSIIMIRRPLRVSDHMVLISQHFYH